MLVRPSLNKEHGFLKAVRRQLQQSATELGITPVAETDSGSHHKSHSTTTAHQCRYNVDAVSLPPGMRQSDM